MPALRMLGHAWHQAKADLHFFNFLDASTRKKRKEKEASGTKLAKDIGVIKENVGKEHQRFYELEKQQEKMYMTGCR